MFVVLALCPTLADSRLGLRDLELVLSEWEQQGSWLGGGSIGPDVIRSISGSVSLLSDAWSEGSVSAIVAGSSQEEVSSLFCRMLEVLEDSESRYSTTYKPNCIQYNMSPIKIYKHI